MKKKRERVYKTSKGVKVTSVYELPHIFAYKQGNIKMGIYKIEDNKFYKNDKLVAIRIGNSLFVDRSFEGGPYGNGLHYYNIVTAFNNNYRIKHYVVNEVSYTLQSNIEQYTKNLIIDNLWYFANLKEIINNSRKMANLSLDTYTHITNEYKAIRSKFYAKVDFTFINEIVGKHWHDCYTGWTRRVCQIDINKTYKQILTGKFYNKQEREIYNAKRFWYDYIYRDRYNLKYKDIPMEYPTVEDKIALYNNKELVNKIIEYSKSYLRNKNELDIREEQEKFNKYLKQLDEWMSYNRDTLSNRWFTHNTPIAGLRFSTNKEDIITSMGARVPTSHAKRLAIIFRKLEVNNEEFIANGKSISIGVYKVSSIKRMKVNGVEEYTLIAGCHTITASIIHKFIEINNLDW